MSTQTGLISAQGTRVWLLVALAIFALSLFINFITCWTGTSAAGARGHRATG